MKVLRNVLVGAAMIAALSNQAQAALITSTFNYSGAIESYTVAAGVNTLHIEVFGAEGGNDVGSNVSAGLGAFAQASFSVTAGQVFQILVGGQGTRNGGGGGSFVASLFNIPMIIAGGGGGSSSTTDSADKHGQAGTVGGAGAAGGGAGGTAGSGGENGTSSFQSGAGGGFFSNGQDGWTASTGGISFVNGGNATSSSSAAGGFGGGGTGSGYVVGGGGGGYSGGGSGGNSSAGVGGGGSSFIASSGFDFMTIGAFNSGNGLIRITSDDSGVVDVSEPTTLAIFGLSLVGFGLSRRARKSK